MKSETEYAYRKRIKELEQKNMELSNSKYEYKQACQLIHDQIVSNLKANITHVTSGTLLEHMKRLLRP